MSEINDSGKVWIKGKASPAHAVRVEDLIIVTGQEEDQDADYWREVDSLCVDLHDTKGKRRIARRFSSNLQPQTPASLFNGFKETQHADVKVVCPDDSGVEEYIVEGEEYSRKGVANMDRLEFWAIAEPNFKAF